ncbi:MAG TPA: glycosyltransferase family protein [Anaerolineales bacterium]
MNKIALLQARMSSSRLPGKVLQEISGRPLLQYMLERLQGSTQIDSLVLATTTDPSDDVLEGLCRKLHLPCYRGSLHDVLDRFYQAAAHFGADVVIRLTADCPLIDSQLLDLTIAVFLGEISPSQAQVFPRVPDPQSLGDSPFDFTANRLPPPWVRTLPIGLDVEVCSFNALERAWKEATEPYQREHVMPFLYEGITFPHPDPSLQSSWFIQHGITPRGTRVALLNHAPNYGDLRWTVDTPQDLQFVRQVVAHFDGRTSFSWLDILALLEQEPELAAINASVKHKSAFDVDQRSSGS